MQRIDAPREEPFPQLFEMSFRQPIAELESLTAPEREGELGVPWPAFAISRWNELIGEGRATHIDGMGLFSVQTMLPREAVIRVLDAVRTESLQLALDPQDASDAAGEPGGPTVADPQVQRAVNNFITNVYGGTPNIAQGGVVDQRVVQVGDIASLSNAARALGLEDDDLSEYVDATLAARHDPERSKLQAFTKKVRAGAIAFSGGISTNVAADQLLEWAMTFLGG